MLALILRVVPAVLQNLHTAFQYSSPSPLASRPVTGHNSLKDSSTCAVGAPATLGCSRRASLLPAAPRSCWTAAAAVRRAPAACSTRRRVWAVAAAASSPFKLFLPASWTALHVFLSQLGSHFPVGLPRSASAPTSSWRPCGAAGSATKLLEPALGGCSTSSGHVPGRACPPPPHALLRRRASSVSLHAQRAPHDRALASELSTLLQLYVRRHRPALP